MNIQQNYTRCVVGKLYYIHSLQLSSSRLFVCVLRFDLPALILTVSMICWQMCLYTVNVGENPIISFFPNASNVGRKQYSCSISTFTVHPELQVYVFNLVYYT